MTLKEFAKKAGITSECELEKVRLIAFYQIQVERVLGFDTEDVKNWFSELGLPLPNLSRLRENLRRSKKFIRGNSKYTFNLHPKELEILQQKYPDVGEKTEEIHSLDTILPENLYTETRGFIESLSKQINASYNHNIFDGCAVLMRRLVEIMLILSYEKLKIDSAIKDSSGCYYLLEKIINDVKTNSTLNLSRNSKDNIDNFRNLGNFSAHKIYFNAKKSDIKNNILEFRALIEELLYKSGIKI